MFGESCSSSYREHNKIGIAIFGFFYDFISILQAAAKKHQRVKNLLSTHPLEVLNLHKTALAFNNQAPESQNPSHTGPRRRRGGHRRRCGPRASKQMARG
jgi:hypothetical protein